MSIIKILPMSLPEGYPLIKVADHCHLESVLLVLETYDWPHPIALLIINN